MNEESDIVSGQFTKGFSIHNVCSFFCALNTCLISNGEKIHGIMVDNCCSVRAKLKDIFGENPLINIGFGSCHSENRANSKASSECSTSKDTTSNDKELRLCFHAQDDIFQNQKNATPSSKELENYSSSFLKRWQTEKIEGVCFLPK